ncbi:ankyrin repeat and BTB/POZ domain-containing protein 2-like isoform X2 [Artemia franciscana]|uniref:BTB domain-containing protein n=1 Tax=Artemia franciscana TaxID=6661 RepID=A0AA88LBQ4_ARTSF|nr:hypothetical protein QYM36_000096 [Artemia franciscana]
MSHPGHNNRQHSIPDFRDVDHYRSPGRTAADIGHEIIRPKPRRPGEVYRASGDGSPLSKSFNQLPQSSSPGQTQFLEKLPPQKLGSRDLYCDSNANLKVTSPRDHYPQFQTYRSAEFMLKGVTGRIEQPLPNYGFQNHSSRAKIQVSPHKDSCSTNREKSTSHRSSVSNFQAGNSCIDYSTPTCAGTTSRTPLGAFIEESPRPQAARSVIERQLPDLEIRSFDSSHDVRVRKRSSEPLNSSNYTFDEHTVHAEVHEEPDTFNRHRYEGEITTKTDEEIKAHQPHTLPNPEKKSSLEEPRRAKSAQTHKVADDCDTRYVTTNSMGDTYVSNESDSLLNGNEIISNSSTMREDLSQFGDGTDCGSLSKSSSEGDPNSMASRKCRFPNKVKSRRRNILNFPNHLNIEELCGGQRRQDSLGGSSSDDNRSSGHASMSDGHTSSSPPVETLPRHKHYRIPTQLNSVPEDDRLGSTVVSPTMKCGLRKAIPPRTRHRSQTKDDLTIQLEQATGLDDIKYAIEQLTLRSHGSARTNYSTSTYSSMSGSEMSEPVRRLVRHSSLETVNTNVTVADEFVWVDSYNRLVELQNLPWNNHDVLRVVQNGRLREDLDRVSMEVVPRLAYLLQRALLRIARETQRLSKPIGLCSKHEVSSAFRVVLSSGLADSCIKASMRAAAMYTVSGPEALKQTKTARAGLQLGVGRFHRWMADVRLGRFIHEYAAVYMTAGIENLLEEIVLQCLPQEQEALLTASVLEHAIATNGDLWGLLQPYAHLNAGRTSSGALSLPRWSSRTTNSATSTPRNSVSIEDQSRASKTLEQSLMTTCVGSVNELTDLLMRVVHHHHKMGSTSQKFCPTWVPSSIHTLFYFMRCSQLEHAEHAQRAPVQELVYERPYIVLPPLAEWVRVAHAHAEHRYSLVIDKDDVCQSARLLLPGVDCPTRICGNDEALCPRKPIDEHDCARKYKVDLAFKMIGSGRIDLVPHALQLLPPSKINTVNDYGMTALMLAAVRGDESLAKILIDAGASLNAETPVYQIANQNITPETLYWTALTYSSINGHVGIARMLLDRGAHQEGGAKVGEDRCTETPLQVASAAGNLDMVNLLLSHGADPFLSTVSRDSLCYSPSSQRGCYSAIAVAAAHGKRSVLHKLLSQPAHSVQSSEVLSLEEILAEGSSHHSAAERRIPRLQMSSDGNIIDPKASKFSKIQIKALQEAMYLSAENGHLDITLDLRHLGVPWTLHCWMHTLGTAQEQGLEPIVDQLLQDFLHVWPDDCSVPFIDECLPLLFNIFRYSKAEGTTLLLADIFSTCYGKDPIKEILDIALSQGPRIDPKFVNNPELSDVQFRVEGRVFFAHKIILVTASPKFQEMLNSKFCDGNSPVIQINDIRYDIFEMVMLYLYKGGYENILVESNDVLELMAAANFFQLDGLLRFCERTCSQFVNLDNVVSMYIHAKVYNAFQLLEYCQGFFLQNMVALLTYDDSVRRLIFGKKLTDHDVLAGLLLTLQSRVKTRSIKMNKI